MKDFTKRILHLLTPAERTRLFKTAAADLLMGIADVVFLVVLVLIINMYTGNNTVHIPAYFNFLQQANPVLVTGVFLALFVIKNLAGVWLSKNQYDFVYGVASRLSEKNMMSYLKGGYLQFVNIDSSVQIRQISQVPIEFGHYVLTNFQQIIGQIILIGFTITAILLYHPLLFVLLLILLFPPVIGLGVYIKNKLKAIRAQIKISSVKAIQYLQESLAGYVESNIYNRSGYFSKRYHTHQQQLNHNIAVQQTLQGLSSRFIEIFALLGFFILMVINKTLLGRFTVDMLTIGIFMAAAYKIIPGIVKIMNSAGQMKTYSFTLDELEAKEQPDENLPVKRNGLGQAIDSIKFNKVSFKFKDNVVIDDLSFDLRPGDFAGISGISGRGKTTMINLLLGFLQQDAGSILINQKPANATERTGLWDRIAYVKQQGFFMNDTILRNIILSDENHNDEKLQQALSISGLETFLHEYPEGIDKIIYEHGKNISGGQRQRLSLARALYHDFELLILDEPFSEMDDEAERKILSRLQALTHDGRMVLFITHNKASLNYCNKIILADAA